MKLGIVALLLALCALGVSGFVALDAFDDNGEITPSWSAFECSESRDTLDRMQEVCERASPLAAYKGVESSACLGIADLQIAINDNCP